MSLFMDYLDKLHLLLHKVEFTGRLTADYDAFIKEVAAVSEMTTYGSSDYYQGIEVAITVLEACKHNNGKLIWIGNGGSAAIASHSAIDYWKNGGIKSIDFNAGPLLTCMGNDYGYQSVFEKPLEMFAEKNDVLIAISSSGKSENILKGVMAARGKGCAVITFSGFSADNPLRSMGDLNFYVPSNHYGLVELAHGVLCHGLLDLLISKKQEEKTW